MSIFGRIRDIAAGSLDSARTQKAHREWVRDDARSAMEDLQSVADARFDELRVAAARCESLEEQAAAFLRGGDEIRARDCIKERLQVMKTLQELLGDYPAAQAYAEQQVQQYLEARQMLFSGGAPSQLDQRELDTATDRLRQKVAQHPLPVVTMTDDDGDPVATAKYLLSAPRYQPLQP